MSVPTKYEVQILTNQAVMISALAVLLQYNCPLPDASERIDALNKCIDQTIMLFGISKEELEELSE